MPKMIRGRRLSGGLYSSLSVKSFTRERGFQMRERGEKTDRRKKKEGERAVELHQ